ncbi:MAG: adenine deaminase ['Candidatus Kapabacteria' thiocyanatum]|uniref:Adenine deaminase n=1 Tax=Candidatus Kapaibacterium thiocyanatum TaxID=1895771 RepID=A0A1M3L1D5_9BACT|nr:adenine deaminase ['Candidatus Kapabacteria' thiocyanatum]OJX58741.1 MAG: adenine deaminase ['Candidatus Kapabacteria' thiocyanatum]
MIAFEGLIHDVHARRSFAGRITVDDGRIVSIVEDPAADTSRSILPGFVDAHVHIESSMLIPSEFARLAVVHGTVATVSDPHEIGNVNGIEGVRYMLDNASRVPFTIAFGAPSCVPATSFETAGAEITADDIRTLFADERVRYLSEMMNFPGVLHEDPVVMEKLRVAREHGRVIDGHAPGLRGDDARRYASHGISTDHECFTLDEALDKVAAGMKIIIREGSAARNYDALHPLLGRYPERCMFCSDDKHPDSLVEGHIDELVRRSLALGYELYDVLRAASVNPVEHYGLPVGLLREGDPADFIVVDDVTKLTILETWIRGTCVASNGSTRILRVEEGTINKFGAGRIDAGALRLPATTDRVRVIEALDGQLVTNEVHASAILEDGALRSDPSTDVLKIVVVNRYTDAKPAVAFIRNIGLTHGALASSVAHDSHNVVAVGVDDADIAAAVNAVIDARGGVSVHADGRTDVLPLPVAGLMSAADGYEVAAAYAALDGRVKRELGTGLRAPFMTLSFMALLVIPALKLSDRGLFDGSAFAFVDVRLDG